VTLVERYLELGLRLGRHVDGLVDAYYGPAELAERANAGEPEEPAKLAADAATLLAELKGAGLESQRTRWLRGQLEGLECLARRLAGEPISYLDEVERCYGVRPEWIDEEVFAAAHGELDEALPGTGPIAARYEAWQDGRTVPADRLEGALAAVTADTRARTDELVGLPGGEAVDLELVENEPWNAFNYYLGGLRSRVVVNTDLPVRASLLVTLVTHECYPGHHTEHVLKEAGLVRGKGYEEETIFLTATPQSLIAEAIAEVASSVLLGDDEDAFAAGHVYPLGIPYEPEVAKVVRRAFGTLRSVATNAALLLHERGATEDEVADYLVRWGLYTPQRAVKSLEFLTDPTWRAYTACYSEGRRLAFAYVGRDVDRFRRLLTEQLVPGDLVAGAAA
jgi:hypothetical protein